MKTRGHSYTNEYLLKRLAEAAQILGSNFSADNYRNFYKSNGFPSFSVYWQRFKTWHNATVLANIPPVIKKCRGKYVKGSPEAKAWGQQMKSIRKNRPRKKPRRFAPYQLRFEIFHRDKFTCQYCGRTPQDGAKLVVDHINPFVNGGLTHKENLITACFECNSGKSDMLISAGQKEG